MERQGNIQKYEKRLKSHRTIYHIMLTQFYVMLSYPVNGQEKKKGQLPA